MELLIEIRENSLRGKGGQADIHDLALRALRQLLGYLLDGADAAQHLIDPLIDDLSIIRQLQACGGVCKKHNAQFLLQRIDGAGNGCTGDEKLIRRLGHAVEFAYRLEIP